MVWVTELFEVLFRSFRGLSLMPFWLSQFSMGVASSAAVVDSFVHGFELAHFEGLRLGFVFFCELSQIGLFFGIDLRSVLLGEITGWGRFYWGYYARHSG